MTKGLLLTLLSLLLLAKGMVFSQGDEKSTLIGNPADDERAANIVADNSGNTYVGGIQNKKGLIVKQDPLYQTLWSKTIAFTTNPNDETVINFLDLVGDTVFGCGTIIQSTQRRPFYFKLNAQTGNLYWSKYDLVSNGFFTSMRYSKGKFFLVGAIYNSISITGKAMAVSSQTGNLVWETPLKYGILPGSLVSGGVGTVFLSSTELYNGKFYVTGYCSPVQTSGGASGGVVSRPVLIGISENGNVFLEKWLNLPQIETFTLYHGQKIHLDADKNLVIGSYRVNATAFNNTVVTKCDTLGNVLFCKGYRVNNSYSLVPIDAMNETANSYVLFGTLLTSVSGHYSLKIDKNGNLEKSIAIFKPNVSCYSMGGMGIVFWSGVGGGALNGNSIFLNGIHYFVSSEVAASSSSYDINQIILDEGLEFVDDCSELIEIPTSVNDILMTIDSLPVTNYPHTMTLQNGIILEDIPAYDYCENVSLDLVQNSGCEESTISANIAGFIDPTFYWSDGTVSQANTLLVNSTDTVFVRVLDTKCCELVDTIIPSIVPSSMTMNLPNDTIMCLQTGSSFTLLPTVANPNASVQYLWSNNSTGGSLAITASGTYWVEVSDDCKTIRDSIVIEIQSMPTITNTNPQTVCEGNFPVNLNPTVSAGASVLWEDGSAAIPRSVNGPGTYTISATNTCGTVNAVIVVSQLNFPDLQLVSSVDTCVQSGIPVLLTVVPIGTGSVSWSDGTIGNQLSVSSSGIYTVYGSNACGVDSATCSVTINHFPQLNLPATLDTCFEIGIGFSYTANGSGGSYQWSSGSQTATEWITQEGIYSVTLTNQCGSITDSILISQIDLPDVNLASSIDTCIQNGGSISLVPMLTNTTSVLWSDGSSGNQLTISNSGIYTVYGSNVCGIDSATCSVVINHFPELDLPATLDTCFDVGVGFSYTAQGSGGSYQWSSGSQTATEWISQEGIYSVTLTNVCGSITDSMQVRRLSEVDLYFPEDSIRDCQKQLSVSLLHIETNYTLEVFSPNGDLIGTHLSESGWYMIHAFNACNEKWDSIYVNLQNEQFFYLPNSFTPNGDSHNDRFEFKGENITVRDVRIFNRWGEEIFTENGKFTGWDGTYRGAICPDGIYAVHVVYEDCFGLPTEFKGHVNLIR